VKGHRWFRSAGILPAVVRASCPHSAAGTAALQQT
jgi:hypothetical protein